MTLNWWTINVKTVAKKKQIISRTVLKITYMKLHTTMEGDPLCILHFLFLPSTWNLFLLLWSIDYPKRKKRQRDRRRKAKGKERKHEIVREQYHRPSYLIQQTLFLPSFSFFIPSCFPHSFSLHSLYLYPLLHLPSLYLCE